MAHLFPGWLLTNREPVRAASHNRHGEECQGDVWDSHHAPRPAAHLCNAKQRGWRKKTRVQGWKMKKDVPWKCQSRAMGSRGGGSVNPEKTLPAMRGYSSAVSGEHLVSLDRVLPTPGQDTDKPGRFLLPVKGRLQGKRQDCWGRIRPRAGSVKSRQPPVTHAQSLQPPIIPQGCDLLGTTMCVCLGTGSGFSFITLVTTFWT